MRVTKKQVATNLLTYLRENEADPTYIEFMEKELEALNRPRKPTKEQQENEILKEKMTAVVKSRPEGVTASNVAGLMGMNSQKATALLTQLVKEDKVIRIVTRNQPLFFA